MLELVAVKLNLTALTSLFLVLINQNHNSPFVSHAPTWTKLEVGLITSGSQRLIDYAFICLRQRIVELKAFADND
jgi:hypothetical protein